MSYTRSRVSSPGSNRQHNESCFSETAVLLENEDIIQACKTFPFTSSDDHEMEDDPSYFVMNHKYSTSEEDIFPYRSVCQEHGGVFQQLTFQATCSEKVDSTDKILHTYEMKITDFVRCYGVSCGSTNQQTLFVEFTLRPMEEKSGSPNMSYVVCDGVLGDHPLTVLERSTAASVFVNNEGADITTKVIAGLLMAALVVAGLAKLFLVLCKSGQNKSVATAQDAFPVRHEKHGIDRRKPPLHKAPSMEMEERVKRNIEKLHNSITNDPDEQWPGAASHDGDEEYAEWSTKRCARFSCYDATN